MITIRESSAADLKNIQRLWADGDVMRFVGFPEGRHETDENLTSWLNWLRTARPGNNHYSIYEGSEYCGETSYFIDEASGSAVESAARKQKRRSGVRPPYGTHGKHRDRKPVPRRNQQKTSMMIGPRVVHGGRNYAQIPAFRQFPLSFFNGICYNQNRQRKKRTACRNGRRG